MTGDQPGNDQLSLAIPSEAQQIVAAARQRSERRARRTVPVDYAALNRMVRHQRAALTRAVRSGTADNVILACRDAVREWDQPGTMWPDDWTTWQRALNDELLWDAAVELEDLR